MRLLTGLVFLLGLSSHVFAQSYEGGLRGTVRDADGVVPGATVQVDEEGTALSWSAITNADGEYAFPTLQPGTYRLQASVPGYSRYEARGLDVRTQTFLTVDIRLEVGSLSETITVEGRMPLVDLSNGSASSLLDRSALDQLPSAGRNVFYSAGLTAGVIPTGDPEFVRQQDQSNSSLISLGGGPRRNNSYVLDGVPIVDVL